MTGSEDPILPRAFELAPVKRTASAPRPPLCSHPEIAMAVSGSLNPKFLASLLPESVLESWRSCSFPGPELGELAGDRRAACLWEQREKGIRTFTPGAYTASSALAVSRSLA